MSAPDGWTDDFFDEDYARIWGFPGTEATAREIAGLDALLPPPPARVLDVSCGDGRHSIALAAKGYEVTGVDLAAPFLEIARRAAAAAGVKVDFRTADVRTLAPSDFDIVLLLGNSFGYHSKEENREAFHRLARAARPGGQVLIELLNRDRIVAHYTPRGEHKGLDGTVVELESTLDPITGVNTVIHRWIDTDRRPRERRSAQRLYTPPELSALCQAAGLQVLGWYDGISERRFDLHAQRLLLVAKVSEPDRVHAADYDAFARAYDRHWGGRLREVPQIIEKLLLSKLSPPARILDLCCGTGQLVRLLLGRGYRAVGLDASLEQLSFARRNAAGAEIVHADARSFTLPEPVDGAVSLQDSLNHMMTLEELTATFRCVRASLRDGAPFVFDMNTEQKYRTSWGGTFSIVDDDLVTVVRASAELADRVGSFDAVVFDKRPNGDWRRADASLRQTWYSTEETRRALETAGFSRIEVHDVSPDKQFFLAE